MSEVPDAYTLGHVPFLGTTIFLDSRPMIPRTETEWWVEKCIQSMPLDREVRVLDLFAGSGCIGVAVLHERPLTTVDFGEQEARHFLTIEKSLLVNGIDPARARVIQTDVWSNINDRYDYVLANPPYLSRERIGRVEDSVLEHEPHEALFAEDGGFALLQKTIAGLPGHLSAHGEAWLEHEPDEARRVTDLARTLGLSAVTHEDQYGVLRYSVILKS